jgi:hypothetical protein
VKLSSASSCVLPVLAGRCPGTAFKAVMARIRKRADICLELSNLTYLFMLTCTLQYSDDLLDNRYDVVIGAEFPI